MKYFSAPIAQTPFTLGLAVHWDPHTNMGFPIPAYATSERTRPENFNAQSMSVFAPIYAGKFTSCSTLHNESISGATLSPYEFCQFDEHIASLYLANPICALREILLNRTLQKELECDTEFLDRVYLDAKETQDIFRHWNTKGSTPLIKKYVVHSPCLAVSAIHEFA
ncbi:unnamed protein product [Echinostoma caproni]|uniref:RES domain-containing protein n=1 Tax=Echinostoma caproni TaxID=27848 RepID=A0A183AEA7_9TREM|nr:unnamed protein product [Echinostoma caproni]